MLSDAKYAQICKNTKKIEYANSNQEYAQI